MALEPGTKMSPNQTPIKNEGDDLNMSYSLTDILILQCCCLPSQSLPGLLSLATWT